MLEAVVIMCAISVVCDLVGMFLVFRSVGREPQPGDEGPKPMHVLKTREGERRNKVISRTEAQEAELEESKSRG